MCSPVMTMDVEEVFDHQALRYCLKNIKRLNIRPESKKPSGNWNPVAIMREYQKRSRKGVARTSFVQKQAGVGRFFPKERLSLASFPREIRSTICHKLYYDLDIVNCAPSLTVALCEACGYECSATKYYIQNRNQLLQELCTTMKLHATEDAKLLVLKSFYGGAPPPAGAPYWWKSLHDELTRLQDIVFDTPPSEEVKRIGIENAERKKAEGQYYNPKGKVFALMLQTMESRALMSMIDHAKKVGSIQKTYVPCFDGVMVLKEQVTDLDQLIKGMEQAIMDDWGYPLKVIQKEMTGVVDIQSKEEDDSMIILTDGENESSLKFLEILGDEVKKCSGAIFARVDGIWSDDPAIVDNFLIDRALSCNFWHESKDGPVPYSSKLTSSTKMIKAARARMPESPEFIDQLWESNKGKVVWKNGFYDFGAHTFIEGFDDIMSTIQINRSFPTVRDPDLEAEIHRRVLDPIFGNLKKPFLKFVARAMAGHIEDKRWGVLLGERDSGKGVFNELLVSAFKNYITTMNLESLLCQRVTMGAADEELKFKFLFGLEFTRLAVTNEMRVDANSSDVKLDGNKGKKLTSGGDRISARKLYQMPRNLRIQATLLMNCNDFPRVDPVDFCEKVVPFQCPHKFTSDPELLEKHPNFCFRADDSIKDWCRRPDVGDAFFWIVADHYDSKPVQLTPEMAQFRESLAEDDEIGRALDSVLITGKDSDFMSTEDVRRLMAELRINMSPVKFYHVLQKRGKVWAGRKSQTRGYYGVQRKPQQF